MRWSLDKYPTLSERLTKEKNRLEAAVGQAESGVARDKLREKLRQLDVATHIDKWLSSPGLRAPTWKRQLRPVSASLALCWSERGPTLR